MPPLFQIYLRNSRFTWPFGLGLVAILCAAFPFSARAQPEVDGNPDSSAFIRIPKDTDDWTRHFRVGAVGGFNISADFNVSGGNISGNNPQAGIYDDGYVRPDKTGSADGLTSYWGYNKTSQYDAAAQTLTMNGASSFTTTEGNSGSDSGAFVGFDMAYGGNLWYWKHARVGWELGFDWLPINITDTHSMSADVTQTTYTFSTAGISAPGAPYQGGYSGQGPLIGTNYTSSTSVQPANISGSRTLDVTLYAIRLGPSFYWDLTRNVGMSLGAGPAIGIVTGNCSYNENIFIGTALASKNNGSFGDTDVIYGGYVNGTVMYHIEDNGQIADIYLGVQYMPMQDAKFTGTGRSSTLNLGGQVYISAGINWPF
jgi:hypothetical protein